MTTRSWIRKLFARAHRTVRKEPTRYRPMLEGLELRDVPASFNAANATELSNAITSSNTAGGTNTITLTAPISDEFAYQISNATNNSLGANGFPPIASGNQLSIIGSGQTIFRDTNVDATFRLFFVSSGATLNLQNLTLLGGYALGIGDAAKGGAIYSAGTLSLKGVTLQSNFAVGINGTVDDDPIPTVGGSTGGSSTGGSLATILTDGMGGAIYVAGGKTTLTNSTFRFNAAFGAYGNGMIGDHGTPGQAGRGGGMYVANGDVTITNSLFDSNSAKGGDGTVVFGGTGGDGGLGVGGAMYMEGGSINATNSTFSNNNVVGGSGGVGGTSGNDPITGEFFGIGGYGGGGGPSDAAAVYVKGGTLMLTQSTVCGNTSSIALSNSQYGTADSIGGTIDFGGTPLYSVPGPNGASGTGGIVIVGGNFASANSIIAGNKTETSVSSGSSAATTIDADLYAESGTVIHETFIGTFGNNLLGAIRGISEFSSIYGDIIHPSFLGIAPLAKNGGPTKTMALLAGSPAINAGSDYIASGITTDQRGTGFPRIVGSHVDIGAYEFTNSPPTSITLSNASVLEKQPAGTVVGTLSTIDPDLGDKFTYKVPFVNAYPDNDFVRVVGNELQTTAIFNNSKKSSYKIVLMSTDLDGASTLQIFNISVDKLPTIGGGNLLIQPPTDIALTNTSIVENAGADDVVGTLSGSDPDAGDTLTFSLPTGFGDNAAFNISGNQLRASANFDYETKSSYSVTVRVTDAGDLTFDKTFTINVTNVNETPTDISLSKASVAENLPSGTSVGNFSTTDPDTGDTFAYTLVTGTGSTDNAAFTIVGNTLKTTTSFDFETKSSYSIRVKRTDAGGLSTEKAFTISVIDVNEKPTYIALSNSSIAENAGADAVVGTLSGSDPDAGDTLTFSLPTGVGDNAAFNINGNQLRASASLDYETKSSYSVTVRVTDAGGLSFDKAFAISVTNVNETPTDISLSNTSVAENLPSGTSVGNFSTTDPDSSYTFTYTLVSGTGSTDNAAFTIVGNQLKTTTSFDFETKSSYSIRVKSTDAGGLSTEKVFTLSVINVNEKPTVTVPGAQVAYEDVDKALSGISVGDPDSSNLTVTLSVGHGALTLGTTTGLTVIGNGTATLKISGSIASLNTALGTLVYRSTLNFSGADLLSLSVSDGSLSTTGSVAIQVKSASEQAASLQTRIDALRVSGVLNSGQANALSVKLDLNGSNGDAGKVQAFLNQVAALRQAGILSAQQADDLSNWGNLLLLSVARR